MIVLTAGFEIFSRPRADALSVRLSLGVCTGGLRPYHSDMITAWRAKSMRRGALNALEYALPLLIWGIVFGAKHWTKAFSMPDPSTT